MKSAFRLLASGLVLGFLLAGSAFAQGIPTGSIPGVVTDSKDAVVAGATVELFSAATGASVRTMTTDGDGRFIANLVPPGMYRLEVSASGFKKAVVEKVKAEITITTRQDITLEAGQITESVNIESTPT